MSEASISPVANSDLKQVTNQEFITALFGHLEKPPYLGPLR
jgi:hypothetical protein